MHSLYMPLKLSKVGLYSGVTDFTVPLSFSEDSPRRQLSAISDQPAASVTLLPPSGLILTLVQYGMDHGGGE